ncbi:MULTISPECIES: hypothetical protein [unclassified Micromonospora]|uniref:hypothetical protein n=1 Tax=unclassified Micromonospora TaxID=2617518 RepID=UPI003643DF12
MSDSAAGRAELDAARLLLARMGISPADLVEAASVRPPAPTFAEYVPVVSAAVTAGTRRAYGSYWNRVVEHWGRRRLDEPSPSEIEQLAEYVKKHVVARRNARGGRAARGQVPPAGSPAPASSSVDDEEVRSLRAAACEANRARDQAPRQAKQMADDLRTALRAAGNLTTRATEQEHELNEATHRINILQAHLQVVQGRYEDSRNLNVVQQAELNEIRPPTTGCRRAALRSGEPIPARRHGRPVG